MTTSEEILQAVSFLIKKKGMKTFRRLDIKRQISANKRRWENNYSPTFQGMRVDGPGRAHNVGIKFQGIFQQVKRGLHTLTEYGKEVIKRY
ncbi:MAG: hypothetical protein ACFFDT_21910 [Candidatus Hodarchaeota archaeon]